MISTQCKHKVPVLNLVDNASDNALDNTLFCLPSGYKSQTPTYCHDVDNGPIYQPMVYPRAQKLMRKHNTRRIIDIGCGSSNKIRAWYGYDYVGLDYGDNLGRARQKFPELAFIECNFESCNVDLPLHSIVGSVIVCSDVIEHLVDPRPLMLWIRQLLLTGAHACILTTPDRHLLHTYMAINRNPNATQVLTGPPVNQCHVREWTINELESFCTRMGLKVQSKTHTTTVVDVDGTIKVLTSMLELVHS